MSENVSIPQDVMAEFIREEIKRASEIREETPEGVDIDTWEHIDTADVEYVEWAHGDVHVQFESDTMIQEQTAKATHTHPAEYKNIPARVLISVGWDMGAETKPEVFIEVVES
jgi:hypothetical protein